MTKRLLGKVAIVTGAGGIDGAWGNGKATATLFAREGAKVLIVDRSIEAAQITANVIEAEGGIYHICQADVCNASEVQKMVNDCVTTFGRVDVLHNNVGILEMGGPVEATEESWNRVIATNLSSIFLTCKYVLPIMAANRAGAIVNVASVAGIRYLGFPYASYAASKAAIIGLTRNVALEYASRGVRVNCVLPGFMNTPMIRQPFSIVYSSEEELTEKRDFQCPMGHMGDAWDTAFAALFLASDEARYITAQELIVDGGLTSTCAR